MSGPATKTRTRRAGEKTKRGKAGAGANGRSNGRAKGKRNRTRASKVTSQEIIEHLCAVRLEHAPTLSETVIREIVQEILAYQRDALLRGRPVSLPNIGTLETYRKKGRAYRHPETGEMRESSRCRYVRLTLSEGLKAELQT